MICAAFIILDLTLIQLIGEYLFTQKVKDEGHYAAEIALRIADSWSERDSGQLYGLVSDIAAENDSRILVTDPYGVVQVDSGTDQMGKRLYLKEVADTLSTGKGTYGYYDTGSGSGWFAFSAYTGSAIGIHTVPLSEGARLTGTLVLISSADELYASLADMQGRVAIWMLIVAAVVLLLVVIISNTVLNPISDLNNTIIRLSRGDMRARVNTRGKGEFARLGQAFNSMIEQVDRLNTTRNEFVSNASHELKTPLTTIKITTETLMYMDPNDHEYLKESLTAIDKEVDRMNYLVNDLLSLVRMDSGEQRLSLAELDLGELIKDTVARIRPFSLDHNINVSVDLAEDVKLTGDRYKLQQVVYNLVDNAIKYTLQGGHVDIEMRKIGRNAVITVRDDGIGIPEKDLPHIYDRFYRVDKARSREKGGTGLGLAIVKQIVTAHSGTISVRSKVDSGTEFKVELPLQGPKDTASKQGEEGRR